MRRADRAGAQNHFRAGMRNQDLARAGAIFDAGGGQSSGLFFEDDAGGLRAGDDREVWPLLRLAFQEGVVSARSFALTYRVLGQRNRTRSTTPLASIVVTGRDARRYRRLDEFAGSLERWCAYGDPKRAGRIVRRRIDRGVGASPSLLRK